MIRTSHTTSQEVSAQATNLQKERPITSLTLFVFSIITLVAGYFLADWLLYVISILLFFFAVKGLLLTDDPDDWGKEILCFEEAQQRCVHSALAAFCFLPILSMILAGGFLCLIFKLWFLTFACYILTLISMLSGYKCILRAQHYNTRAESMADVIRSTRNTRNNRNNRR